MTTPPTSPKPAVPNTEPLDPANQSLADALRKSFRVLKLIMFVLVALYFLSGWFSVQPGEVGLVLRYGRIVGAETGSAVLPSGWHWSWPYPIDRWERVPTHEREIEVQFLYELSDEERAEGIKGYKYGTLSPWRDDYLMTGDASILHASLVVKYRITDPVAYLTNVKPMPDPAAGPRTRKVYLTYPEYTMLSNLARNAVIETAARRSDLDVRGVKQSEFLAAVGASLANKLKALEASGFGLGISLDPNTGVLAPKTSGVEGIFPPRQVQEAFEQVDKTISRKGVALTKAASDAQNLLVQTAGLGYQALADAIEKEFELMLAISSGRSDEPESKRLREQLKSQRTLVERLLKDAAGDVRNLLQQSEIFRDRMVKEAAGDYEQFTAVRPEYERNTDVFVSQFLSDTLASALANQKVGKMFVPESARGYWLQIPRSPLEPQPATKSKERQPGVIEIEPMPIRAE